MRILSSRILLALLLIGTVACTSGKRKPDFEGIYADLAKASADTRRPVIVIPGILGSKLELPDGTKVWGAFTRGAVDTDVPEGARIFALPMEVGTPLSALVDDVKATAVLDVVVADLGPFTGLRFAAYIGILGVLNVGGFRDFSLGESGALDYGDAHYTCYQYPYDWRRDIATSAAGLAEFIRSAQDQVRAARNLSGNEPVPVDVVAHSMGGLVLRYYLRYGAAPLPEDGTLPQLTWEGARHVRNGILVGTPNGGSASALEQLLEGMNLHPFFPNYRPSVLGTLPSIYQLLPRAQHHSVVDEQGRPLNLFDLETWVRYNWGLANSDIDRAFAWLLPGLDDDVRRSIALDHLAKCLVRAQQLHAALDLPATPPEGTRLSLFAGDAIATVDRWRVNARGKLRAERRSPGDGTVTRKSALGDERPDGDFTPGVQSPVNWDRVQFLFEDHVGMTNGPAFLDNMLYQLLEDGR